MSDPVRPICKVPGCLRDASTEIRYCKNVSARLGYDKARLVENVCAHHGNFYQSRCSTKPQCELLKLAAA